MIKFALTAISSFSTSPLKIASWVGFATSGVAVLGMLYVLGLRLFTSTWVEGWTALMLAVLFIGGIQLLVLGIMGVALAAVASGVYLVDVRPKILEIQGKSR